MTVGRVAQVANRNAFHGRRVIECAYEVADGAATAWPLICATSSRQKRRATLRIQVFDGAVEDVLIAQETGSSHDMPPSRTEQRWTDGRLKYRWRPMKGKSVRAEIRVGFTHPR